MTDLTREEIRKLVLERFSTYLEHPDGVPDDPFDLKSAINDDKLGRPREAWHMEEFAKVDDLIDEGYETSEACQRNDDDVLIRRSDLPKYLPIAVQT